MDPTDRAIKGFYWCYWFWFDNGFNAIFSFISLWDYDGGGGGSMTSRHRLIMFIDLHLYQESDT